MPSCPSNTPLVLSHARNFNVNMIQHMAGVFDQIIDNNIIDQYIYDSTEWQELINRRSIECMMRHQTKIGDKVFSSYFVRLPDGWKWEQAKEWTINLFNNQNQLMFSKQLMCSGYQS